MEVGEEDSWLTIVDFWFLFLIFDLQEYTKNVIARRNDEAILFSWKLTVDSLQCFLDYILIQKSHINTR